MDRGIGRLCTIRTALRGRLILAALICVFSLCPAALAGGDTLRLRLNQEITPATAEVVGAAIHEAEQMGAAALEIQVDTPGGLDTSMREIVSHILASKVPVIVYVAPSGARAASAGFVILLASDLAAMAPGTVTGAAHPVMMDGRDIEKTMAEKVTNDASAYVRSLALKRGRDPAAAESAIRESRSFTEQEASQSHLIEIIARDENDLLAQIDGRVVGRFDGATSKIETGDRRVVDYNLTARQRLLIWLVDPRVAFLLFAIGALCIYFEFQHPGMIAPGALGAISIVLALYGFHMLPINLTGVLLISVALVLFVLEVKLHGFGILGLAGIAAATVGSLILIDVPDPRMRLPLGLVLSVVVPFGLILMGLLRLAYRARHAKVNTGIAGMIGQIGRAQTAIAGGGTVFVRGELWRARSRMRIEPGEPVQVTGLNGLTLEVEPDGSSAVTPRETSAIDPEAPTNAASL
jgi:membrane-bound serine protease (ClpP class)